MISRKITLIEKFPFKIIVLNYTISSALKICYPHTYHGIM